MTAKIVQHPHPAAVWPGIQSIDPVGAAIAREMLEELEGTETDERGLCPAEYCQIENWVREAQPFRNVVAEYAARAQDAGPAALQGFCAALSDFIAQSCQSLVDQVLRAFVVAVDIQAELLGNQLLLDAEGTVV